MMKVVSKMDGKTYFKTKARFRASADDHGVIAFIGGETYWVRKPDDSDKKKEGVCIIKGNFDNSADSMKILFSHDPVSLHNGYSGTYYLGLAVDIDTVRNVLEYCD